MRDSADWFQHDANASRDEDLVKLKLLHGRAGKGFYWEVIEFLCEQPGYSYPKDLLCEAVAPGDTTVLQPYNDCISLGLFIVDTVNRVTSRSLKERMGKRDAVCAKNKANIEKRWQKQEDKSDTTVLPPNNDRNTSTVQKSTVQKSIDNIIYTGDKSPSPPEPPEEKSKSKPKKPKRVFDPEGKKKFLDWVYLSDEQFKSVQNYYEERNLSPAIFDEAVRILDAWYETKPQRRAERTDDGKALKGWPLDEALKREGNLIDLERKQTWAEYAENQSKQRQNGR